MGRAHRSDEPEAAAPGVDERLDDAHQDARRHAHDGRAHAGRNQGLRSRLEVDRGGGRRARIDASESAGHAERSLRALARRDVRGRRAEARCAGALRSSGWRSQRDRRTRHRGRAHHDHGRGARALYGQRSVQRRLPLESGEAPARLGSSAVARRRSRHEPGSPRRVGRRQDRGRPTDVARRSGTVTSTMRKQRWRARSKTTSSPSVPACT